MYAASREMGPCADAIGIDLNCDYVYVPSVPLSTNTTIADKYFDVL